MSEAFVDKFLSAITEWSKQTGQKSFWIEVLVRHYLGGIYITGNFENDFRMTIQEKGISSVVIIVGLIKVIEADLFEAIMHHWVISRILSDQRDSYAIALKNPQALDKFNQEKGKGASLENLVEAVKALDLVLNESLANEAKRLEHYDIWQRVTFRMVQQENLSEILKSEKAKPSDPYDSIPT